MRRPAMRSPMSASHPGRSRPRHPFALALLLALPVAAWSCTVEHHPSNGSLGAELTSDDCTASELFGGVDDSLADVYRINLHVRTELTVTLESADFDAFVVVLDEADTRVAEDDDSHGNLNAALTVALEAGSYRIVANSATTARKWAPTSCPCQPSLSARRPPDSPTSRPGEPPGAAATSSLAD